MKMKLLLALGALATLAGMSAKADVVAVYEYYNSSINDYFYTSDYSEIGSGAYGWSYADSSFAISDTSGSGKATMYRYLNIDRHFYTTNYSRLGSGSGGWSLDSVPSIGYEWTDNSYYNDTIGAYPNALNRYIDSTTHTYYYTTGSAPTGYTADTYAGTNVDGYVFPGYSGTPPFSSISE